MKTSVYAFIIAILCFSCSNERKTTGQSSNASREIDSFVAPSGKNASLPYLITGADGHLYFSWVEKKDSGWVELNYSRLNDGGWSDPELIASGNDWFVNWADYPMVAVDSKGNMMAHYLAKSSTGTYSYDVNIVIKKAGADTWSDALIPHDDGTPTEHGFVTMLPQQEGAFRLAWLDGRNTGGGHDSGGEGHDSGGEGHDSEDGHGSGGAMTLRTAAIDMEGTLTEESELDNRICDCCQTTGVQTASGPVYFYRDRSALEIRDIFKVRLLDNGWTKPQSVYNDNWNIEGCPVNGPRADAIGNSVAIAWFTAAQGQPKVKLAFSQDGGSNFSEPILIDGLLPLGRVDVLMLDADQAVVSWLTRTEEKTIIKLAFVRSSGLIDDVITIAETDEARASGFPQIEKAGQYIYAAYTRVDNDESSIQVKRLPIKN